MQSIREGIMNRLGIFTAGLISGIAGTVLMGQTVFPGAAAASPEIIRKPKMEGVLPENGRDEMQVLELRCAPGFRHTPESGGRYGCNRIKAVRCPRGTRPANVKLYRSGSSPGGTARLIYECRMNETVRPQCGRGFKPVNLKLYRSGMTGGGSRLIYECIKYRRGN